MSHLTIFVTKFSVNVSGEVKNEIKEAKTNSS